MVHVTRILTQIFKYSNWLTRKPGAAFKDFPPTIPYSESPQLRRRRPAPGRRRSRPRLPIFLLGFPSLLSHFAVLHPGRQVFNIGQTGSGLEF